MKDPKMQAIPGERSINDATFGMSMHPLHEVENLKTLLYDSYAKEFPCKAGNGWSCEELDDQRKGQ
jgi:hypothetical protein